MFLYGKCSVRGGVGRRVLVGHRRRRRDLVEDIPSRTRGKVVCDEEGVGKEAPGPQKPARSLRIKKDQWVGRSCLEMDLFRSNEGYGRPYDKGYSSTAHAPMVDRQTNASLCAPY